MIHRDTQTTQIFEPTKITLPENPPPVEPEVKPEDETISDLNNLPPLKEKNTIIQRKLNENELNEDVGELGLGRRERFRNEMLRLKNDGDSNVDLNRVIHVFDVLFKENNDDLIEKLEILYSCTATYTSHFFSFEEFERNHEKRLISNLKEGKLIFPDLFNRYID